MRKIITNPNKKSGGTNRFLGALLRSALLIYLLASVVPTDAQEYTYFTQYMFNGMAINPAYASVHDHIGITTNIRKQWVGMEGSPSTQTISGFAPVLNNQFGLGVNIINDRVGARSQQEVSVNYAYKVRYPDLSISMGLKLGFNSMKNHFDELYIENEHDANFLDNSMAFMPMVGFGGYLKARNYYVGLSVPQLYRFVNKTKHDYEIEQQSSILINAGYLYRINRDFKIRPNAFARTQIGGVFEMDLNANLYYKDDYCVGLVYKSLNSLALILEIGIDKTYYIGYSYDMATSNLIWQQSGTHEISVNVILNRNQKTRIVNPRYF